MHVVKLFMTRNILNTLRSLLGEIIVHPRAKDRDREDLLYMFILFREIFIKHTRNKKFV